jgi:curved DNA-binding protein CbpA
LYLALQVKKANLTNASSQKLKRQYKRAVQQSMRTYSTEAAAPQKMSLKNALRKFYMIVHPDRLTGHPKEMKTNDDSFRSLNSYLDTFKNEKATDSDLDQEYTVKFYVPKQGESGFTVASSALKQPPRGSSQQNREKLIHDSLVSLFKQCGLDIDVDVVGFGAPAASQGSSSGATAGALADPPLFKAIANLSAHLGAFAKKNTPAGKKLAQIHATHQQAFDAALKRISTKHHAAVLTDLPPFQYKSSVDRLQTLTSHLKKLEEALDKLGQSGPALNARLGQKTPQLVLSHKKRGWASTGHFYVDVDQSADHLVSFFDEHARPEGFELLKDFAPKRAQKESTLKSALDLASVSSEHNIGPNQTYLDLLDAVGADIASNSHKWILPQVARGKVHLRFTDDILAKDSFFPIPIFIPALERYNDE